MLRILSWNVQRLKAGAASVVEEINNCRPNIVVLQEFQLGPNADHVKRVLAEREFELISEDQGFKGFITAIFSDITGSQKATPDGLSIGAQWWSEASFQYLGLSAIHIPTPNHPLRKQFWDVVIAHAHSKKHEPHAIVGDFNTTREKIDNEGRMVEGKKHLAALVELGWVDAWRQFYPNKQEFTWFSSANNGFRLDQMWISPKLASSLQACRIEDGPRIKKFPTTRY